MKFALAGLGSDAKEEVIVWFKRITYAELLEIQAIVKLEGGDEESLPKMCDIIRRTTFDGDKDVPLFDVVEEVQAFPVSIIRAFAQGLMSANGYGAEAEDTIDEVKNDSSETT